MANFPSFEQLRDIVADIMVQLQGIKTDPNELTDEEMEIIDFIITGNVPCGYYFQSGYLYGDIDGDGTDDIVWTAPDGWEPPYVPEPEPAA